MRVATWNVNNVRKRLPQLLAWLAETKPDVVALQELKTVGAEFPRNELAAAGYNSLVVGQKTWNGVAILCRGYEPIEIRRSLPGDDSDKQARYIEAAVNGVLVACLYLPNGNPWPGPKFLYKMAWFQRFIEHAASLWASGNPIVLAGDFNVVPTDADIYSPDHWRDNALLQPEPRAAYAELLAQGWTDSLQTAHPGANTFTFWDYRRNRWERDAGLRIDHVLLSGKLKLLGAGVDRAVRGQEDASDHAPVWVDFELAKVRGTRASATPSETSGASAVASAGVPLGRYNAKRDFGVTPEPAGKASKRKLANADAAPLSFVIQKHWASRLHYDFRLEFDGVLLSWAIPKGPSFDPKEKRIAVHVEDHPVTYGSFEGTIPARQYGAGTVIVWDNGTWEPVGDPRAGMKSGKVVFKLHGQKLAGLWELVRIAKPEDKEDLWILLKKRDAWSRPLDDYDVISSLPDSVVQKPLGLVEHRDPRSSGDRRDAAATASEPGALPGAKKAALPAKLEPQLATLAKAVPSGDWAYEIKFDGYRLITKIQGGNARLFTRGGHDWTAKMEPLAQELADLGLRSGWIDGEAVVLDEGGKPNFGLLQNAFDAAHTGSIVYFAFDLPFYEGYDLRKVPLDARRALLKKVLATATGERVRFSEDFPADAASILQSACAMKLEGVMAKRRDAPYVDGARTETWLKLKCQERQEFVVIGFTDRENGSGEVGSLLLAYHDDLGQLRYGGSVGTGWDAKRGAEMFKRFAKIEVDAPAIDPATIKKGRWSKKAAGGERWVKPSVVAEVSFSEWTSDGHVRHPVFVGLRADKPAKAVTKEEVKAIGTRAFAKPRVAISNPDRVIDASTGLKKRDLVHFYESIADWILPHLKGRPVSLVRGPTGVAGELFFQKHDDKLSIPGLRELDPKLWPGHQGLLEVASVEALVNCAQMNVIEFHTWNSTTKAINKPARVIFDLDPGEGTTWAHIQEAAILTRTMLEELGLKAWLKTSGGKGLHVVVPLAPRLDYETVKAFSQSLVQHMTRTIPSRFVAKAGGSNRIGKIFIDYLRNGHAQTTAAAFSARARPGMGVSIPVSWDQLPSLKSGSQWTITTAREYLSFQKVDPWQDYFTTKQMLNGAIQMLEAARRPAR